MLSLPEEKIKVGCWLVVSSGVNYQLLPRDLKLKPSDIIWPGVVEPKEQGPSLKNERTQLWARMGTYHHLSKKSKLAVGCLVVRWSKVNFTQRFRNLNRRIIYGLGWFTQNFNSYSPKMAECSLSPGLNPIIISGKSRSWLLAVRWFVGQKSTSPKGSET